MVLRRLVLLTVVLHLFLKRSQLFSFDFIEHMVRHEGFVSHYFSGQLFLLLTYGVQKHALPDDPRFDLLKIHLFYVFRQ